MGRLQVLEGERVTPTARWPRTLSAVYEGIEIWYYPPPIGPRTWAFRMPGTTEERHYTRQNGAKDAIRALREGL